MDAPQTPSVFGRGFRLDDGDLPLVNGDLVMVAGRDNFLQGVRIMIDTPFASDVFNIRYGFDLLACVSAPQPPAIVKELIRLNIVRSLSTDDRIRQIREIAFDDEARFFELSPESDPGEHERNRRLSREWQAIVLMETVEQPASVIVSGVGA
jgi:phage baseplate assembly protein W